MLVEEYKRSLKMPEAEEVFDLIFYRPLAFVFVKLVYRSPVTPNQVTLLSMIAGLIAAIGAILHGNLKNSYYLNKSCLGIESILTQESGATKKIKS